jgi:hypothetical protein
LYLFIFQAIHIFQDYSQNEDTYLFDLTYETEKTISLLPEVQPTPGKLFVFGGDREAQEASKRLVPEEYFQKYGIFFQKTILYPMAGNNDSFLEKCNPDTMKSIIETMEKVFRLSIECGKAQFTYCLANIRENEEKGTTGGKEMIRETRNSSTKMRIFPMVTKLSPFPASFLEFLISTKPLVEEPTHVKRVMTFNDNDFKERNPLSPSSEMKNKVGSPVSHSLLTRNDPYQTYVASSKASSLKAAQLKGKGIKADRGGRNRQSKSPAGRKPSSSKSPTTTSQGHQQHRLKAMKSPRQHVLEAVRRKETNGRTRGERRDNNNDNDEEDDDDDEVIVEFDTVDSHRNTITGKKSRERSVGSSGIKKSQNEEQEFDVDDDDDEEEEEIEWTTNHPMVGKKVAAFFSLPDSIETFKNILFYGTVMKYAPPSDTNGSNNGNDALYRIKWSDGDSEDYDEQQLNHGIDLYLQQISWITDSKVNSVIGMKVANYFDILDPMATTVKAEKGGSGKKTGKRNSGKEQDEMKYIQKIFQGIVIKYLPPSKEYTVTANETNGSSTASGKKKTKKKEQEKQVESTISAEIREDEELKGSIQVEEALKIDDIETPAALVAAEDDDEEGDQLYHIKWEDGDEQDYSENELQRARKIYLDHYIHKVLPATLAVFVDPLSLEAKINPSSWKSSKSASSSSGVATSKSDPTNASWDTSPSRGLKTLTASVSSAPSATIVSPSKSSSSASSTKSLSVASSSSSSSQMKKNRSNTSDLSSAAAPALFSPQASYTSSVSSSGISDDNRVWLTSGHSCMNSHVAGHFTIPNLSFSSSLGGNKIILFGKVLKYSPETSRRTNNALYYIEWEDGAEEVYSQIQYEKGMKIYNLLANKAGQEGNTDVPVESPTAGRKEKVKTKKRILKQTVDMEENEEADIGMLEEDDSEMDIPEDNASDDDIMAMNSAPTSVEERKKLSKSPTKKSKKISRKRKQRELSQLVETEEVDDGEDFVDDDIEIQIEKLPKKKKITENDIPSVISSASLTAVPPHLPPVTTDRSASSSSATVEVVSLSSDSIEMPHDAIMEEASFEPESDTNIPLVESTPEKKEINTEVVSPPEEYTNEETPKKVFHLDNSSSELTSSVVKTAEETNSNIARKHYRFLDDQDIDDNHSNQVTQN